jgi:heptose I phosphotransferase
MKPDRFIKISPSFFADPEFAPGLRDIGLDSIDAVFAFTAGANLSKARLAAHRTRIRFEIKSPPTTGFLKRYENPPLHVQLRNSLDARRHLTCAECDFAPAADLAEHGIRTPQVIAYGRQWLGPFEKRSFVITRRIESAASLEQRLPPAFYRPPTPDNIKARRKFISKLADFIRTFHNTDYRHRDLYLCHIFADASDRFYLLDLARTFRPLILSERFRVKDLAQLFYSSPASAFPHTDKLRFYMTYAHKTNLDSRDKALIRKVIRKAHSIARHARKHGATVPFRQ